MQSKLLTLELLSYHSPSYRSVVEEMGKEIWKRSLGRFFPGELIPASLYCPQLKLVLYTLPSKEWAIYIDGDISIFEKTTSVDQIARQLTELLISQCDKDASARNQTMIFYAIAATQPTDKEIDLSQQSSMIVQTITPDELNHICTNRNNLDSTSKRNAHFYFRETVSRLMLMRVPRGKKRSLE
jgi:hypothetical protein